MLKGFWKWCHLDSNQGHKDFQSFALPTELWHHPFGFANVVFFFSNPKKDFSFFSINAAITCQLFDKQKDPLFFLFKTICIRRLLVPLNTEHFKKQPENQKSLSLLKGFWKWCHLDSNQGHKDFQSFALPTELWHHPFGFANVVFFFQKQNFFLIISL